MVLRKRITHKNVEQLISGRFPQARLIATEAIDLGYKTRVYEGLNLLQITHNRKNVHVASTRLPINSSAAAAIADNKFHTVSVLDNVGIPVPRSVKILREDFYDKEWDMSGLKFPVVIKPAVGSFKGRGVVTNIQNRRALVKFMEREFQKSRKIMIEEFHGNLMEYRVLVLDGKVIGAVKRVPAYVIGNGKLSIRKLIGVKNKKRRDSKAKFDDISIDAELLHTLKDSRLLLRSIPKKGKRIQLKRVCNMAAGGEVFDATEDISSENSKLAVKAVKALGLRMGGVDFLCKNINRSIKKSHGVILEINQCPDLLLHHYPNKGKSRNVTRAVVKSFFK